MEHINLEFTRRSGIIFALASPQAAVPEKRDPPPVPQGLAPPFPQGKGASRLSPCRKGAACRGRLPAFPWAHR